jgi:hypothetical protein
MYLSRRGRKTKREWGLTSLPAPTVRGRSPARRRFAPWIGVPAEALRPRSVPFRVPFRSRSSFRVPKAICRSELRQTPFRFPPGRALEDPESRTSCRSAALASFRFPTKRTLPSSDRISFDANVSVDPFAVALPEGSASAGPIEESGVGIGPKTFASRFFLKAPGLRALRLSRRSAATALRPPLACLLSVSGETDRPAAVGE